MSNGLPKEFFHRNPKTQQKLVMKRRRRRSTRKQKSSFPLSLLYFGLLRNHRKIKVWVPLSRLRLCSGIYPSGSFGFQRFRELSQPRATMKILSFGLSQDCCTFYFEISSFLSFRQSRAEANAEFEGLIDTEATLDVVHMVEEEGETLK